MQCHSAVTLESIIIQYNPPGMASILTRFIGLSDFVWPHTHHQAQANILLLTRDTAGLGGGGGGGGG